jgi:hypothetical protein
MLLREAPEPKAEVHSEITNTLITAPLTGSLHDAYLAKTFLTCFDASFHWFVNNYGNVSLCVL